jgi:hypothetical protein
MCCRAEVKHRHICTYCFAHLYIHVASAYTCSMYRIPVICACAGLAVDHTLLFVGGNSCAPDPPPHQSMPRSMVEGQRRASTNSVSSHGLHFPLGLPASHMGPAVYRGDDHITYSRRAEVLWRRPREPCDDSDMSVCNAMFVRGMQVLSVEAASGFSELTSAGSLDPEVVSDVHVHTSDGRVLHSSKLLLAASAPMFFAMFSHDMQVRAVRME